MKYSIGYRLPGEFDNTVSICNDYKDHISNVYFSFADEKSGRLPLCESSKKENIKNIQLSELRQIKDMGKTLTLLLNANCYGEEAVSLSLKDHIITLCKELKNCVDIDRVTTTSPYIAESIKEYFKDDIHITASVNMRIATIKAMEQLSSIFDGFYVAKECNRTFESLNELRNFCNENGKKLSLLANSGCLPYCAYENFHDNLVAHQDFSSVIDTTWSGLPSPCHRFLRSMNENDALAYFLGGTWIRPEDITAYENFFDEIKLATRMHDRARMVISAYVRGKYKGNLLDLTEPSFSKDFKGTVLDNTLAPKDFFEKVSSCTGNCEKCGYCKKVAKEMTIKIY